jgi:cytochrome c oxidase assembly protein subunit 15
MTDWHLVTDTFPPMSEAAWQHAFAEYQKFPEYQKINIHNNFTLSDYKFIYFWEWFHRLIGRVIGMIFIIPFAYFWYKKQLDKSTLQKCFVLLGMGALQGFFGWFMVKSGLVDNPDVSHFRLSLHLTFAFLTFAYTLWVALDLVYPERKLPVIELRKIARWALVALIFQIIYGGFVAGLNAGLMHNHWPLMSDGQFIHDSVWIEQKSLLLNLTEGKSGVQFVHRTFAYIVAGLMIWLLVKSRKFSLDAQQQKGIYAMNVMVVIQFALGIFTLLNYVPISLGLLHQVGAFILLSFTVYTLHRLSK